MYLTLTRQVLTSCAQEAELRDLKPRLESKQVLISNIFSPQSNHALPCVFCHLGVKRHQEAVEELLTKQRSDIRLLREAEAKASGFQTDTAPRLNLTALRKAARLELEVESLKGQLAQSKVLCVSYVAD